MYSPKLHEKVCQDCANTENSRRLHLIRDGMFAKSRELLDEIKKKTGGDHYEI